MTQPKRLEKPIGYDRLMADIENRRSGIAQAVEAVEREHLATHDDLAKIYLGIEILADFGNAIIDNLHRIPAEQKQKRREESWKLIRAHTACHALILKLQVTESEYTAMKRTATVLASRAVEAEAREIEYRKRAGAAEAALQLFIDNNVNDTNK
jgi:hypothetical protein